MNDHNAIELEGVSKAYEHFALSDIDLRLEPGSVMGFIGPNGAGKSTTIRILMGLVRADAGRVEVLGHRMPGDQVRAKRDIGFASEDMRLYPTRTLQWHIDFCRGIYPAWDAEYAAALLQRFDLHAAQRISGFSHGQRVKAGLLLVLARRPRLLLLDEPTTGLDPVARSEVLDELMDVLRDERRSILFSSHNTQDVEQFSDQITFIDRGRIVASEDKETYVEKWRRIRVEVGDGKALPALDGVTATRHHGRLATLVAGGFDAGMRDALERGGAKVQAVERMTLEEIFVAEVKASRAGGQA